jgi:hypothetical protein
MKITPTFTSVDKLYIWASLSLWCHLVYEMLTLDVGLPTRKQYMGTVILQIQSSSCPAPHYEDTNYRQKTTTGFPLGK